MNTEKEIQQIKEVLNDLINYISIGTYNSRLKGMQSKLNQPAEPEPKGGYEGVGKWYVTKQGSIFHATSSIEGGRNSTVNGYGYNKPLNTWTITCEISCYAVDVDRLATSQEIQAAILKGCEQKGIVKGARVRCLHNNDIVEIRDINSNQYYHHSNDFWSCGAEIFDNGKFAEVVWG